MSKQASRRVAQFNLLFTPSELRELKRRAYEQTGGNVSELIRRTLFPPKIIDLVVLNKQGEIVDIAQKEANHV